MSEKPKKISVNDLPDDAVADLNSEDIQPAPDSEVKGGARVGFRVGQRAGIRVGKRAGLRDVRKIQDLGGANTWIKK